MKVIKYQVTKKGSHGINIITRQEVTRLKKTRFEVVLFNRQVEKPYRCVALVEARERYLQDNLEDAPEQTLKHIAQLTVGKLRKKGLDIVSVL